MYVVRAIVRRIVDGDTVAFSFLGKPPFALRESAIERPTIRLWGVDAPESNYQGQSQGEIAERAKAELANLLKPGNRVAIHTAIDRVDGRGRLLGRIFKRGQDVNKRLLSSGWTLMYQIYPNLCDFVGYRETFIRAMKAKRGLHAISFEWPFEFRQRVSKTPPVRYVGDFSTGYYWYPPEYHRVTPENRIFFNTDSDALHAGFVLRRKAML